MSNNNIQAMRPVSISSIPVPIEERLAFNIRNALIEAQSLVTGTVREIHAQDGQSVAAGDLLLSLDSQQIDAEINQLQSQLGRAKAGLWRTQLLLRNLSEPENALPVALVLETAPGNSEEPSLAAAIAAPAELPEHFRHAELALATRQYQALQAEMDSLSKTLLERQSERLAVQSELQKWQLQLPLVTRRANSHKKLASQNHVSQDNRDAIEQQRIEIESNLHMAENRNQQLVASIDAVQSERVRLIATQTANLQAEQHEFVARIVQLEQELIKTQARQLSYSLLAPVNGSVQQLVVHTVGGVVTPAEPLMKIVPDNTLLEVEAMLANKDIGFVNVGQELKVKVDAFPFTRYGALKGSITSISADAVEMPNVGWVYSARVKLASADLRIEGKPVSVTPGMSAVVEIKTGKRKLVEYVLSPLLRYRDESVRER